MISRVLFIIILSLTFSSVNGQNAISVKDYERAESKLRFTTSSLVDNMNVSPNWLSDNEFWYEILTKDGVEYKHHNIKNNKFKSYSTEKELKQSLKKQPNSPQFNRRKEVIAPDKQSVVFIRDWNLWLRNLENNSETQITFDGEENFGYATDNAGWRKGEMPVVLWSPDSKKISTFKQDQRHVSDMHLVTTNVGAPELKSWKYPLPEDERIIEIHRVIIDLEKNKIIKLNIPPDPRRGTLCDDIACTGAFDDNEWSADGNELMFVSSSRDHKIAKLRLANATTGDVREIFTEEVETQYESGRGAINWSYLEESNEIIWYSERDDWGHLYLYNSETGKLKHQITKGEFVVSKVKNIDEKNRKIIFEGNGREEGRDPYFNHLYSINFSGKNLKLLSPENGNHQINFSPDFKYFIDNYSQPDIAPVSVLRDIDGNLIDTIEMSDISRLLATGWKPPKQIKVKSENNKYDLYGLMFSPSNLDENKKYPIINYIYPGPQGGSVGSRSFNPGRRDHQALAELGFIVVAIDGTCNPYRSKSFHDECYGEMSVNTLPDQISGMKQLANKYSFIDIEKVGIWGHSGGGFATATAMFRYPDFFDVGISESGNHDNRNYEDDWGERYIGLLVEKNGKSNYDHQANQNYAGNLKGKLLLAHGGMDDNVPPYNTNLVVEALIKANKDFDLLMFPNARHGYGADSLYMMRKRWDYFVKNLLGKEPPKEYKITFKSDPRTTKV